MAVASLRPHQMWGSQSRILRPSAVAETQTWADYANGVLDSLLAVDFRGAASLAAATLYGSTPSVIQEPVGGLNLTATGLVCDNDTMLDTGITIDSSSGYVMFVRFSNGRVTSNSAPIGSTGSNGTFFYNYRIGGIVRALWLGSENLSVPSMSEGSLGFIDGRYYADGVHIITLPGIGSPAQQTIKIGTRGDTSVYFGGNIEAVCIGTLKAGQDADTVASELHSRMQTPVITLWYLANGAIDAADLIAYRESPATDGSDTIAHTFTANQPLTIAAKFSATATNEKQFFHVTSSGTRLQHDGSGGGTVRAIVQNTANTTQRLYPPDTAVVFLVMNGASTNYYYNNAYINVIGAGCPAGSNVTFPTLVDATLDQFVVYDAALTADQLTALYVAMTA